MSVSVQDRIHQCSAAAQHLTVTMLMFCPPYYSLSCNAMCSIGLGNYGGTAQEGMDGERAAGV